MQLIDIKNRVNELISLADRTLATEYSSTSGWRFVEIELYSQFQSASLSFLKTVFTSNHPLFEEFKIKVIVPRPEKVKEARGILNAAKQEIDNGWLVSVKELVSGEIFSDFLEMAEYLLEEGYKDPAAVMIGGILEEQLRHLCTKNGISVEGVKDGKPFPKKAELMNSELTGADVLTKLDQKSVTAWLDVRNKAAHGKYSEYNKSQVQEMYLGVLNFITRTNGG